jgi:hypothetical protein
MEKLYRMYLNQDEPDSSGNYLSNYVGHGRGHIETGINVVSNTTGGFANLTGNIQPQKVAVFSIISTKTKKVFVGTDGYRMTFQNKIGANPLSFIRAFLEFILQSKINSIDGDEYEGIDGKKSYVVQYVDKDCNHKSATMTNGWDSPYNPLSGEFYKTMGGSYTVPNSSATVHEG